MNLRLDKKTLRLALLVVWFDLTADSELQNRIRNELWCLRNDVDTTALSDLTVCDIPTTDIYQRVITDPKRSRNEQAALVLCTMREFS